MLTCDTTGIIAPVPFIIGSVQAAEALKILVEVVQPEKDTVFFLDVWERVYKLFEISRRDDCPACNRNYEYLDAKFGVKATSLCGQNAIQILNPAVSKVSFKELSTRLERLGKVTYNDFMLNYTVDLNDIVVFPDGRAIIKNTADESVARGLYAKYIGN